LIASPDSEILVSAEVRIKGRNLLFAFGDQDFRHGMIWSAEQRMVASEQQLDLGGDRDRACEVRERGAGEQGFSADHIASTFRRATAQDASGEYPQVAR
jgi:hypothetical protein